MPDSPLTADAFARSTDAVLASVSRVIDGKPAAVRAALVLGGGQDPMVPWALAGTRQTSRWSCPFSCR